MPALKIGDAQLVFNGKSQLLKLYMAGESTPRHVWACHDVGVNDASAISSADEYGHYCKCPPGKGYVLGAPQKLDPPEVAYGFAFTPVNDDPDGDMSKHGRAGIGVHGGGSDLADPFASQQGWEDTFGCFRLQNVDNAAFVAAVQYVQSQGGDVYLDVVWP